LRSYLNCRGLSHRGPVSAASRRFAGPLCRRALIVAAAALLCSIILIAGGGSSPRGGQVNLHGLTLWTTLPASHYGPGQEIRVYCTLINRGTRAVSFTPPLSLKAAITSEGEEKTYPQSPDCGGPGGEGKPVVLEPGERWVTCFVVKPPRKEFLPGTYPLRVYCDFGDDVGKVGGMPLKGTLVSNEVVLTIHYNIFWVS
jgi:hypothetical protein